MPDTIAEKFGEGVDLNVVDYASTDAYFRNYVVTSVTRLEKKIDTLEKNMGDMLEKKIEEILEKKLDKILEKKLEEILEKKLGDVLEKKLEEILEEILEKKLDKILVKKRKKQDTANEEDLPESKRQKVAYW